MLIGGDGRDRVDYAWAHQGVTVDLASGTASGDGTDRLQGIENARGSAYADALTGDTGSNWLAGGGGDDRLAGGGGNDTLIGGEGNDMLVGGIGHDSFVFAPGSGTDIIRDFQPGSDIIDVHAFGFSNFATLAATFEASGHDTLIHLSPHDTVHLVDVSPEMLFAHDFFR